MQNESRKLGQSESRVEPKGMTGLQTSMGIIENGLTNFTRPKDGLLEFILSPANLNAAYKKVKSNKGSGGIDGMSTEGLLPYLREHGPELVASLREGTYKPNPVRRVEIPKSNGKKRGLGIPTVVDRVVQQAISQVLEVLYEPQFSETSYGFRPHRGAHKALLKCGEYRAGVRVHGRYGLGEILRHGQPLQADRSVVTYCQRRSCCFPDTSLSECRSNQSRQIRTESARCTARRPSESDVEQHHAQ